MNLLNVFGVSDTTRMVALVATRSRYRVTIRAHSCSLSIDDAVMSSTESGSSYVFIVVATHLGML
jgi:hypothetical protein